MKNSVCTKNLSALCYERVTFLRCFLHLRKKVRRKGGSNERCFSNFSCMFLNPNIFFSNLNSNCSNLLDMTNLQGQVKKVFR